MQAPYRVTAPATFPVTLDEVKAHLRVFHDDDNTLLTDMIGAATSYLDGYSGILGRCLVTQVWHQHLDAFPDGDLIELPFPDVSGVTLSYRDPDNVTQTFGASKYAILRNPTGAALLLGDGEAWPDTAIKADAVSVQMTVGYGAAADVPGILRFAIREHVRVMYTGETQGFEKSPAYCQWVAPFRRVGI